MDACCIYGCAGLMDHNNLGPGCYVFVAVCVCVCVCVSVNISEEGCGRILIIFSRKNLYVPGRNPLTFGDDLDSFVDPGSFSRTLPFADSA